MRRIILLFAILGCIVTICNAQTTGSSRRQAPSPTQSQGLSKDKLTNDKILAKINDDKTPHAFDSTDILNFFIVLIVCAAIIWGVSRAINWWSFRQFLKSKKEFLSESPLDALVSNILNLLYTYNKMAITLHSIYVFLGATTILTSVFVSTFLTSNATLDKVPIATYLPLVSFASTASISLISAFSLGNKANNSRRAWRLLSSAFDIFMVSERGHKEMTELIKKRDEAEIIVGGVDFKY